MAERGWAWTGGGAVKQAVHIMTVPTQGQGLAPVTPLVEAWLRRQAIATGLLTVFCQHSSASLLIQENADPTVRQDLEAFFRRLAPEGGGYAHDAEGPDDMPAHIRAALTQTQLSIPGCWRVGWRSAPGRDSMCGSIGPRRTGAHWCCICSATDQMVTRPAPWRRSANRSPSAGLSPAADSATRMAPGASQPALRRAVRARGSKAWP